MSHYYVYIMSNKSRTLYIGYTNDLFGRVMEHKQKLIAGFTSKYNINRLLYWETYEDSQVALKRERQLKGWRRARKQALINTMNLNWKDLSEDWGNGKNFTDAFISTHQRHWASHIDGLTIAQQLLADDKH